VKDSPRIVIFKRRSVREWPYGVRCGCWCVDCPRSARIAPRAPRETLPRCRGTASVRRDRRAADRKTWHARRGAARASRCVAHRRRASRRWQRLLGEPLGDRDDQARRPAPVQGGVRIAQRGIQRARRGTMWHVGEITPAPHQSFTSPSVSRTLARPVRRGEWMLNPDRPYNDSCPRKAALTSAECRRKQGG